MERMFEIGVGQIGSKTIHLVVSFGEEVTHAVTAYEPNPALWEKDFTKRKKRP